MPKAYSIDLRDRVVDAYRSGQEASAVAERFGVCIPCVYRWDKLLKETGALHPLYKAGDRSSITDDDKFLAFAKTHSHSTLTQMADAWGSEVSIFAVSRKLRKLGITRKKELTATLNATKPNAKPS
jgi:transposase